MWISKRLSEAITQPRAERGNVTIANDNGVEAGGTVTTRGVQCYMPYGYTSTPPVGKEVMMLPSSDGQVIIGSKSDSHCNAGEVVISSLGGARIELKNDGTIVLNSLVIDRNGEIKNDR